MQDNILQFDIDLEWKIIVKSEPMNLICQFHVNCRHKQFYLYPRLIEINVEGAHSPLPDKYLGHPHNNAGLVAFLDCFLHLSIFRAFHKLRHEPKREKCSPKSDFFPHFK